MRKVALVGAGVSKFGVRKASYRDLIWEAGKACFDSLPAVKPKDIDGLVVGSVMPERTAFQSHISSMAAEALGIRPSSLSARTEHMCASGTVGIRYAYAFIAAGLADLVMVLGVEKLNQPTGDEAILNMGTGVDREWEAAFGLTAPPCFALAAQRHMAEYGTTEEQLARVGVKNHTHASKNPNAHFNKGATLDQVLCSRMISSPLRLFMCSPITDGAAAVILASEERARDLTDKPVWIRGTGQALDGFQLTSLHEDYAHWPALERAAKSAYAMAGVTPADVDLAEVHDCFSIAEMIAYEELGFCAKGEAGPFVAAGRSDYGGDVVVNPRGGLIGCGHPLGATGVAQAAEVFVQLRDEAGARQVPDAAIGLTHNNSGMGEHVVMIYGNGRRREPSETVAVLGPGTDRPSDRAGVRARRLPRAAGRRQGGPRGRRGRAHAGRRAARDRARRRSHGRGAGDRPDGVGGRARADRGAHRARRAGGLRLRAGGAAGVGPAQAGHVCPAQGRGRRRRDHRLGVVHHLALGRLRRGRPPGALSRRALAEPGPHHPAGGRGAGPADGAGDGRAHAGAARESRQDPGALRRLARLHRAAAAGAC